jgi:hypothetical protein
VGVDGLQDVPGLCFIISVLVPSPDYFYFPTSSGCHSFLLDYSFRNFYHSEPLLSSKIATLDICLAFPRSQAIGCVNQVSSIGRWQSRTKVTLVKRFACQFCDRKTRLSPGRFIHNNFELSDSLRLTCPNHCPRPQIDQDQLNLHHR